MYSILRDTTLEIETEVAGTEYDPTPDELTEIDEGLAEEAVSEQEVKAALVLFGTA